MAEYPQTGSILDSKTRTALSTQIVIMVNGEAVGAVQSFSECQESLRNWSRRYLRNCS